MTCVNDITCQGHVLSDISCQVQLSNWLFPTRTRNKDQNNSGQTKTTQGQVKGVTKKKREISCGTTRIFGSWQTSVSQKTTLWQKKKENSGVNKKITFTWRGPVWSDTKTHIKLKFEKKGRIQYYIGCKINVLDRDTELRGPEARKHAGDTRRWRVRMSEHHGSNSLRTILWVPTHKMPVVYVDHKVLYSVHCESLIDLITI